MMHELSAKDEAKKEGLMELIKKMYAMMDANGESPDPSPEHEAMESEEEEALEHLTGAEAQDEEGPGGLMAKAMGKDGDDKGLGMPDLDLAEIKEFLSKRRKSPMSKSINIMAVTKASPKKFDSPKMKKYG